MEDVADADAVPPNDVVVEVKEESLLAPVPSDKQLYVEFSKLSGWVSTAVGPPSLLQSVTSLGSVGQKPKTEGPAFRQIMYGISANCKPGEVLALMGPSGSGKTSVLSVMGGRTPDAVTMEGSVLFNGEKMTKAIKKRIGYVLQDDLLYETLTVFETLYFAAILRLPSSMTAAEKTDRVEAVIKTLGLTKCKNTIVGGAMRRGVSGGERKRVSIAVELLINPSAIFLDEPTSGLDSTTAMHLMSTLRQLASGGRSVVTTIHQPSSRLYMKLDKLLLLSEGHVMYYGQADIAADWFERLGYLLPRGVNQADFFLDLASGDVSAKKIQGEDARLHCIACAEKFLESHPDGFQEVASLKSTVVGDELWNAAESRKISVSAADGVSQRSFNITSASQPQTAAEAHGNNAAITRDTGGSSWVLQYTTLLRRAIKVRRFEALSMQDFSQMVALGVLGGLFWLQAGQTNTTYGAQNSVGELFFITVFSSIRTMLSALFVFPPEFKMILKERASGMYNISSYYLARTSSDLAIDLALPSAFVILLYFMGGLAYSASAFFETLFTILLLVLVSQSFGLLIGAVIPVPKTAQTLTTVVALTMVLVAGFFVTNIHGWISWLKFISFLYYAYSLMIKIQYKHRDLYYCGTANFKKVSPDTPGCTLVPSGKAVQQQLHLERDPNEAPWEAAALIAFLVFMRTLVYLALRWKTRSKIR